MAILRIRSEGLLSLLLVFLFTCSILVPLANALDSDNDGFDDSIDDCQYAQGNSTVDRDGCPDRDGDGTSDWNDRWTMTASGWAVNSTSWQGGDDLLDAKINPDGTKVAFALDTGWVRVHSLATQQNVLSRDLGDPVLALDWSSDGLLLAATVGGGADEMHIMHSNNLSDKWSVDTDTGGNDDAGDVEFSPDATYVAFAMGRANNDNGVTGFVRVYWVNNGTLAKELDPSSEEDAYDSIAWSPDGRRLAFGGRGQVFIHNVGGSWSGATTISIHSSGNQPRVNSIDWSPDGNWIAACDQYSWGSQGNSVHVFNATNSLQKWDDTGSTTCLSVEFSPDSRQLGVGWNYYSSNGNQLVIHDTFSGNVVDTLQGPCSGGCGTVNGFDWHPSAGWIISAHGRDNERGIWWRMDPDIDGDGWFNDVDDFPEDGTQWADSDNDGYGDNPAPATQPDDCPNTWGNSTQDRFGCVDSDGDGWSDLNDAYPNDKLQWSDADGDGYPDNTDDARDPSPYGSVDYLPNNSAQWNDSDGDGYGDNYANASWNTIRPSNWPGIHIASMTPIQMLDIDTFPIDPDQWNDTDGDWVGDEQFTTRSDGCVLRWGDSVWDRLGCPDSDGDGWSDPDPNWPACISGNGLGDAWPSDASQWCDSDGDGYGDNGTGTNGDACPSYNGTSTEDKLGCKDSDGDGWSDSTDQFDNDPTQWSDRDNDMCGDNPDGNNPDLFPDDGTQCGDRDGDGYGDFPNGPNGDWFPDEPTQWYDTDRDGFGDNYDNESWIVTRNASWPGIYVAGAFEPDLCPAEHGTMDEESNRGCPDSDQDGVADNEDAFPEDPLQSSDRDGDGFGDDPLSPTRDDCPDVAGTSDRGGTFGCPDSDGDGWADERDDFPNTSSQWKDSDEDGWGDNWGNTSLTPLRHDEWPGEFVEGAEKADAFPLDASQWNDSDADGWGDNPAPANNPDVFPFIRSQWKDGDADGYGDNTTRDAYQPDDCRATYGTSYEDRFGCLDSDGDGWSDLADICKYDPEVWEPPGSCAITEPEQNGSVSSGDSLSLSEIVPMLLGGIVVFLLLAILVAMISRQAAKRSGQLMRQNIALQEQMFDGEEKRREDWIEYYLAAGDIEKAKELGYVEKAQWQIHEEEKQQEVVEQIESLPDAMDLDDLL